MKKTKLAEAVEATPRVQASKKAAAAQNLEIELEHAKLRRRVKIQTADGVRELTHKELLLLLARRAAVESDVQEGKRPRYKTCAEEGCDLLIPVKFSRGAVPKWCSTHKKEKHHNYRKKNPDKVREQTKLQMRAWVAKNRERYREQRAAYSKKNRDHIRERERARWANATPEKRALHNERARGYQRAAKARKAGMMKVRYVDADTGAVTTEYAREAPTVGFHAYGDRRPYEITKVEIVNLKPLVYEATVKH